MNRLLFLLRERIPSLYRKYGGILPLLARLLEILRIYGLSGVASRLRLLVLGPPAQPPQPASPPPPAVEEPPTATAKPLLTPLDSRVIRGDSGALLVGHPYGVLGRGEDVRTAARSCYVAKIPFHIRNTFGEYGREDAVRHKRFELLDRIDSSSEHRANIFFLNADEMKPAYDFQGHELFDNHYNIGVWAWELSRLPKEWDAAFAYLDELWAPSRFIQQALADATDLPVVRIPLPVEPVERGELSRAHFELPEREFLFLFFFDFRSYVSRKNPHAVLRAFKQAFAASAADPVRLVIKLNGRNPENPEHNELVKWLHDWDERVIVMDRVLDDVEINGLVRLCDCFVSLHRSEGFGRGVAEAMYYGRPVISTAYSGTLDFTSELNACLVDHVLVPLKEGDYPYGAGQVWADADEEQAAWYMRKVVRDEAFRGRIGELAAQQIHQCHSYEAVGAAYRRRLERLGMM